MVLLGAWFSATLVTARMLGPAAFGLYTLCQNAIRLFTGCFGEPLDMAVMRSAPLHLATDRPRALAVVRAAFWLRAGLGVLPIVPALLMPAVLSWLVFGETDKRLLALLTAIGMGGDLLLRSSLGFFQVSRRFGPFLLTDIVWQLGRSFVMVVLAVAGVLTAGWAVGIYIIAPYVAFSVAMFLLPGDVRTPRLPPRADVVAVLHYSKWMTAALAITAIYERLDVFLLQRFRGAHDVGVYAGALTLAVIPDFLSSAMQTVLAPRVAPAHAERAFGQLHRKYLRVAVPAGAVSLAIALLLAGPVLRGLLSNRFAEGVGVFRLLIIGTVVNIVLTPLPEALLNFVAPRRVLAINAVGLVIVAAGGWVFIPRDGVIGAAAVFLMARVVTAGLQFAVAGMVTAEPLYPSSTK